ncbi:GntR family transcriptional regulator [Sulfitobacter donghicola]|uniref:GntR family transcriptional regulator n=1 Tax=Sulfitobacter donghicola DSW-25 = KCTC 12864 = JCM 14565 TaxID=1300350 RepID=A0A073IJX7_9RHOB|nr:GntR family transcriptional regulator [Sulfitobacter donghicola]KEJ89836.1 GntR family transcriptional regulator [Sulfitobacter donghicola DSW-25 = KCTC 12864 = JCM 14565]KIN67044.1 HTH-type GntR family transcriptional regulator [Sulfitobacter donghicola DSW-25 = KCTC 12864 = JCM 14565]
MDDLKTRTTTDVVYETLHDQIISLEILPGTKLSETDVARRFGVSRQPVRNAFTKLGNEDLLLIRPQKATEVRGFSMDRLELARLVRRAVELEVVYSAIQIWDASREEQLAENLKLQEDAIANDDLPTFHALDYDFHKLIYVLGGNPNAFEVMLECKQKVERLCMLGLEKDSEAKSILQDHRDIASGLASGDVEKAQKSVRHHLSRLDKTIAYIHKTHPGYFE